jgi:hypothetical protein
VATLVARNTIEVTVALMVGFGGVWSQAVGFVLVLGRESGFSRREVLTFCFVKNFINVLISVHFAKTVLK